MPLNLQSNTSNLFRVKLIAPLLIEDVSSRDSGHEYRGVLVRPGSEFVRACT